MSEKRPFDLRKCARPNILALPPYKNMRDDFPWDADMTLLDANENSFGPSILGQDAASPARSGPGTIQAALDPKKLQLHRYPNAQQTELKQLFCDLRNSAALQGHNAAVMPLQPDNICLGVGSDESIDVVIRVFCTPGKDKILICPPTYGMYEVSASANDVAVVAVELDAEKGFALRADPINETLSSDPHVKVVFVCSPANPTGNLICESEIVRILEHPTWNGVVVVDEAYVDFAPGRSLAGRVNEWPNLIVTQTLSKAFGLAGIRLGVAFSQSQVSQLLNNLKGPFNMSSPTIALATAALQPAGLALMEANRKAMIKQRDRIMRELPKIPGVGGFLGGCNANFLLVQFLGRPNSNGEQHPDNATAAAVARALATDSCVLVRYRGMEPGCVGSLRITVGTEEEVDIMLVQVRRALELHFGNTR
ncbi:histidinol-phosphate aminotransferase [Diaporthe helianthi]|uniref:histidinol-phosphate transaminase n=1 Tax=Diaporthe helianthi TaxID=158607 RepID=A0A2P5HH41_DIAHE|nr:histidinol-phosphate aminotransferase [Diaporthe helianthi]